MVCRSLSGTSVKADERAPEAPGLVELYAAGDAAKTTLLIPFRPSYHTVLIFSGTDKPGRIAALPFEAHSHGRHLQPWRGFTPGPRWRGRDRRRSPTARTRGHRVGTNEFMVVIAWPDSFLGGITYGLEGAKTRRYLAGVFGALVDASAK
ncbi:uncharacterized protein C8Q71DRAFT_711662 [Rhodofomes roseus]|uniref:Uncharacterized protein n=1 Tax=Rhodofomes roseus TaxID=34475 RepID=A0ABQ8K9V0_9APHY|nr:uncharacterized protein C8Q71DRAFT_711662 [Rhodofomes roseus]KAH9834130.1 hypothetical protein C8Q71DRAFT_711662 [Rhodofomes roseus]